MVRRGFVCLVLASGLAVAGCGPSLHPVDGVLTVDGAPVSGATVTFVSADGNKTYSSSTDAAGKFSLVTGEKPGVESGTYKVLVVKYPVVAGGESLKPSDPEYVKQMEKNKKDAEKASKAAMMPPPGMGGGGMRPPMGMMPGGGAAPPPPKSELPAAYASAATTPLSFTVPLPSSPLTIEIKKDAPKK